MNERVQINGDTGVAVNAEEGAIINIHVVSGSENKPDPIKRAVHVLLKTCDEANCRAAIERISQSLFGSTVFKDLSLEQLGKLQTVAEEFKNTLQAQQVDDHAVFMKEMDEYEDFLRRTGMRASKQERVALNQLMIQHSVRPLQVKKVWENQVLVYENGKLQVKLPVLGPLLGSVGAVLSICGIFLICFKFILGEPSLLQFGLDLLQFLLFVLGFTLSYSTIVPGYIGKQIKAKLEAAQRSA
jgi:hypothetical protein